MNFKCNTIHNRFDYIIYILSISISNIIFKNRGLSTFKIHIIHVGKLLLDAAAATHERAARAQRLCRQLRAKAEGNAGGGLLAGVLDRERQRTVRLLMLHRRRDDDDDDNNDEYVGGVAEDENSRCCCRLSRQRYCGVNVDDGAETSKTRGEDFHDCWSDDECADAATDAVDHCSGDQDEFTGIAGIPGLDVDRGVLIRREYPTVRPRRSGIVSIRHGIC